MAVPKIAAHQEPGPRVKRRKRTTLAKRQTPPPPKPASPADNTIELRASTTLGLQAQINGLPADIPTTEHGLAAVQDPVMRERVEAAADHALDHLTGAKTHPTALRLLHQIVRLQHSGKDGSAFEKGLSLLGELGPSNATEALLAVQMIGAHDAATLFLARASDPEQTVEGADRNVNRSVRLMRLFVEQLEAMAKLKGKSGQQRVVVEHVNVEAGGQAVVGSVEVTRVLPGGLGVQ